MSKSTILCVDDNPDDIMLTKRALHKSNLSNPFYFCTDGREALDYLSHRDKFAESKPARPSLILLDMNMPGMSGADVLKELRANPDLASIPVVMLTSSDHPDDVERCFRQGANSYLKKPMGVTALAEALARLNDYWFEFSITPRGERPF